MVDSQVEEIIENENVPTSSIPSFINASNEMYYSMDESESSEEEIQFSEEEMTQFTPLSLELREEVKGSHRNGEIRKMALLCLKNKMKVKEVAKQFKVTVQTIHYWKKQWKKEKSHFPKKHTGRPRILWEQPVSVLLEALKKNPSATNEMLTAKVHNMIAPRTVSDYLKRENITVKRITDGGAQKMDDRIIGETRDFYMAVKDIPWEKRVYMDESFVYNNEASAYGRSVAGEPINRVRDKRGKRLTIYLAIRVDGLVHHPILKPENADDVEFMKYVEQTLVHYLRPGEVVIWDRLGRSGRAKNPCKQHYNPRARQLIEAKGCRLMILPPKGKYSDPIELVFGLLKGDVRKTYGESLAAMESRPRTEAEIRLAVLESALKITPKHLHGFFKERANGRSFKKVYRDLIDKVFH